MENTSCIFCKIINGEIPCHKVYEDADLLAFLDINPVRDGHALIIPKDHVAWMHEASDTTVAGIFQVAKKLMSTLIAKLPCEYVQVSVVGKDVPHFHVHLIPRDSEDGLHGWPTKKYNPDEAEEILRKLS